MVAPIRAISLKRSFGDLGRGSQWRQILTITSYAAGCRGWCAGSRRAL